jgi:hypothetical protein
MININMGNLSWLYPSSISPVLTRKKAAPELYFLKSLSKTELLSIEAT